ncbi:hypothetical protein H6G33_03585 [Calothrix sp. FACHB-1219]|uniref:hypothetical protein n=1 Tax=unclassified Calothrix TaxID=2619626 RepID=UPI0016851102|nr:MULTISPECIES: hypothetical protein [unclassified Calothrix]MBD2202984.1 hypothetical protein [Calothrix sp. FACHB-168]MBD2216112.1 hypothetical protein [Calothrix sp. FACHB-1219]
MVNGQWSMVNGQWSMVNSHWSVGAGLFGSLLINEDIGEPARTVFMGASQMCKNALTL